MFKQRDTNRSAFVGDTMSMTLNCHLNATWQKLLLNMANKKAPISSSRLCFEFALDRNGRMLKWSKRKQNERVYEYRQTQPMNFMLLLMNSKGIVRDKWFLTKEIFLLICMVLPSAKWNALFRLYIWIIMRLFHSMTYWICCAWQCTREVTAIGR